MEYTKKELKMSLLSSLSLMRRGDEFKWVTFDEIDQSRKEEWYLFNAQKRLFYRSYMYGQATKRSK